MTEVTVDSFVPGRFMADGETPMRRHIFLVILLLAAPALRGADFNVESSIGYTLPVSSEGEMRSTFSALMDNGLTDHWHFVWGGEYERFDFEHGEASFPGTLQAAGGHLGLEYRVDDEPVFLLQLQPGWHAGENFSHGTYDVPVTLASGYPITKGLDVALGVYYSRLSAYPFLPVGGLVWKINDKLELDLLFPSSTLSWSATKTDTFAAFAEEIGTGFQVDGEGGRRLKLEYYQTRTGLQWEHEFAPGWSSNVQAGWALERTLDFYQQSRSEKLESAPFVSLGFKARF